MAGRQGQHKRKKPILNGEHLHLSIYYILNDILKEGENLAGDVKQALAKSRDMSLQKHQEELEREKVKVVSVGT